MTDEQKRIAIAESVGWKFERKEIENDVQWTLYDPADQFFGRYYCTGLPVFVKHHLPDYLNNRDAIVAAIVERFKTEEQQIDFACALQSVCEFHGSIVFRIATATARQLSDAYLNAL